MLSPFDRCLGLVKARARTLFSRQENRDGSARSSRRWPRLGILVPAKSLAASAFRLRMRENDLLRREPGSFGRVWVRALAFGGTREPMKKAWRPPQKARKVAAETPKAALIAKEASPWSLPVP